MSCASCVARLEPVRPAFPSVFFAVAVLHAIIAAVACAGEPSVSAAFPAGTFVRSQPNWIRVSTGTAASIEKAVVAYSKAASRPPARNFTVVLSRDSQGFFVLTFPQPLPAHPFMNLVGWLDAPPSVAGVSGAQGWFTSPRTSVRYALQPDRTNPSGDTLVGFASDGRRVVVYQPEVGLCTVSRQVPATPEPVLPNGLRELRRFNIAVSLEYLDGYNPGFVNTHPPDHKW